MARHIIISSVLVLLVITGTTAPSVRAERFPTSSLQQRPTLRSGDRGPAVQELQTALNTWIARTPRSGLATLPVSSYFGPLTEQAVKAFQAANGLVADGIVGPRTWTALDALGAATPRGRIFPIVDGDTGFLLGGTRGGGWLNDAATASQLRAGEQYRLFTLTGSAGQTVAGRGASAGVPCDSTTVVQLAPKPTARNTIAISAPWNPLPRIPVSYSTQTAVYRDAIAEILQGYGITRPDVRLTKVLRVDLEGDGASEVVISATRLLEGSSSPRVAAGDYSVVVVRKVIGGKVTTLVVDSNYYLKAAPFVAPQEFTIPAILDLNGDGRMEIVVDGQYYEGASTLVYEITGARHRAVLETGCGV